jgi:hypothetical protein
LLLVQITTEKWPESTNPILGELEVDVNPLTRGRHGSYSFSALHFESTVRIGGDIPPFESPDET